MSRNDIERQFDIKIYKRRGEMEEIRGGGVVGWGGCVCVCVGGGGLGRKVVRKNQEKQCMRNKT